MAAEEPYKYLKNYKEATMASTEAKILVGAGLAGLAAGVLFAPKSGKETRADIQRKAQEMSDKASHKLDEGKEKVADLKQHAVEQTKKVRSSIFKKDSSDVQGGSEYTDSPILTT
jgi:gas vesicle protein